jgi:hypothetical protein
MLIELGVPIRQAIRHARSRKGPWQMAKTIAGGVGMTGAWLTEQRLLSLKTFWASLVCIRPTARCGPACHGGLGRVSRKGSPHSIRRFFTLGIGKRAFALEHVQVRQTQHLRAPSIAMLRRR